MKQKVVKKRSRRVTVNLARGVWRPLRTATGRLRGQAQRSGSEVRLRGQAQRSGSEVRLRGQALRSGSEVRLRSQFEHKPRAKSHSTSCFRARWRIEGRPSAARQKGGGAFGRCPPFGFSILSKTCKKIVFKGSPVVPATFLRPFFVHFFSTCKGPLWGSPETFFSYFVSHHFSFFQNLAL